MDSSKLEKPKPKTILYNIKLEEDAILVDHDVI